MTQGRPPVALPLLLLLAVACAGPQQPSPDRARPAGPLETVPAPSEDVQSRADQARELAARSVEGVRDDIAGVRAAQRSVTEALQSMGARLATVRDTAVEEGLQGVESRAASLEEGLERLAEDSGSLLSALHRLEVQVDEFERWAATVYERALKGYGTSDAVRNDLAELESEAAALSGSQRLTAYSRRSSTYVRDLGQLDVQLKGLEGELAGERALRQEEEQARASAAAASGGPAGEAAPTPPGEEARREVADIVTSEGTLTVEFFAEVAPRHVRNFKDLARAGFYDGLTFHRVIPDFLAQGGDPLGNGSGGPGWSVPAEFSELRHERGTLGMARFAHPDSAGSQFYLCLDELPELDGRYTVFGRLLSGQRVLERIEELGSESGVPSRPIVIEKVVVRERRAGEAAALVPAQDDESQA